MFYAIGDPGRAAVETGDGTPPGMIGQPDVTLSMATVGPTLIRAASSRGVMHRGRRVVRQDAYALGHRSQDGEPDQAVIVVCDGVGSLAYSHYAAALVSTRLVQQVTAGADWPPAFENVNAELAKTAAEWEASGYSGMATTAVGLTAHWENGYWLGQAAWQGDSALWHLSDDRRWTLVSGSGLPEETDYHSSQVWPLPADDACWTWCSFRAWGGALFAMTDGVSNPLMWNAEVQHTLADWWARPPDPYTFAAQVGFAKKTHVDDRTVVGLWPGTAGDGNAGSEVRPGPA
jgi:hypothetical protein